MPDHIRDPILAAQHAAAGLTRRGFLDASACTLTVKAILRAKVLPARVTSKVTMTGGRTVIDRCDQGRVVEVLAKAFPFATVVSHPAAEFVSVGWGRSW